MFERFTEGARRAIFYARYEASRYGSRYIETEHLLLGVLREGPLRKWFPGKGNIEPEIRAEIEKRITRQDRISTSVEVPLTRECQKVLHLASETVGKLGHRNVELEHLLIAIFRLEESLAAQVLLACAVKSDALEERLKKAIGERKEIEAPHEAKAVLEAFLIGIKSLSSTEFLSLFSAGANFVDASGKRWDREEIDGGFETLFAFYAKKNASYAIENTFTESRDSVAAIVLWKNSLLASEERTWMHRMTVLLVSEADGWKIQLLQVTPVKTLPPSA
jgi:hypothetical protein